MSDRMESQGKQQKDAMLIALKLYVTTLQDTRAIVPSRLSLALQGLKATPIFRSKDVENLMELNLDIYVRWVGEDISGFTPYIRHDELSRAEAEKMLKAWAKTAIKRFVDGLKSRMQEVQEIEALMSLRREVLEVWLSQHQHSIGVDAAEVLDALRYVFNDRAITLIKRQAHALEDVGSIIKRALNEDWQPGKSDQLMSLWSPTMTAMETNHGAKKFRQKLLELSDGKNGAIVGVCDAYQTWLNAVEQARKTIL